MYDRGFDQPKLGGSLQFDGVLLHRVSPLHIIFDLKGVLVKYSYFTINCLQPSPHKELWNPV